jgi:hypothetical protein
MREFNLLSKYFLFAAIGAATVACFIKSLAPESDLAAFFLFLAIGLGLACLGFWLKQYFKSDNGATVAVQESGIKTINNSDCYETIVIEVKE